MCVALPISQICLRRVEYLTQKMTKAENMEKQILQKQISEIQREIETISELKDNELMGGRYDDHDWQKISNIDFEGLRESEEIQSFWQNYLHPSINKTIWKDDEIEMLKEVAQKHMHCNWNRIADELGTNRTAFMCLQTYQRYICTDFRRRNWNSEEDKNFRELVEKMRIGNFIPYAQISYFMEGRDSRQLMYRWTQVLDPTLKKGFWSKEEDEMLRRGVAKYGVGNWWKIRQGVPGRTDGQCRDRYLDVLIGNVKKGPFDEEELALLRRLVEKYGHKWSKIASEMPNRLDHQVLSQWRRMTGYKRKKLRKVKIKKTLPKRAKVMKQVENEDVDSNLDEDDDEEEDIEFMDSDGEKNRSDEENEGIEVYNQPDMEQWLPVPEEVLEGPGTLRTLMVERPSQDCSVDEQEKAAKKDQQPARTFMGVRSTILDRSGNPVSTVIGKDPPILSRKDYKSNMTLFKASYDEVRSFIQWKKSNSPKQRTNESMNDVKATSTSPSRPKVSSSKTAACTLLNCNLQLAVLPWVGNVLIPPPLSSKKLCEADMVRERASGIRLGNTPVFLLFLQVLRVDSQGCKQIFKMHNEQAALSDTQQALPIKPKQQYDPNTVTGILYQMENEHNQSCQQQRMTIPVDNLRLTKPVMQSVATSGPQLSAVSPVLSGPLRAVISTPLLPHSGTLQTSVLTVPPGSQSADPQRALDVALPNSPNPAIQSDKSRKITFDPKLMFTEDLCKVGMWFRGKNGVTLPELDVTLPYLPPFVSNLTTLSALLKHKPMLAANAKLVLTPEEKNQSEEDQIAAVRSLVAERFSHNPGYLLLKARFLSCFTMPAFLATIDTVQRFELSSEDYSGEEELLSNCSSPEGDTGYEELPALQMKSKKMELNPFFFKELIYIKKQDPDSEGDPEEKNYSPGKVNNKEYGNTFLAEGEYTTP